MNIKKIYPILIMGLFLFLATYGQTVKADDTLTKAETIYEGRDYYSDPDVNKVFDPSNPKASRINFMQWQNDFKKERKEVPKGVYVGQTLSPSVMELDYKPVWEPDSLIGSSSFSDDATYGSGRSIFTKSEGNYGVTLMHIRKTFSASEIMNGASEFWVELPIFSQQLTTVDLTTSYIIEGTKDEWKYERNLKIHSGLYMFDGSYDNFTINGSETAGIFDLRTNTNVVSKANAIINKDDEYNNSVYQKMNVVVESDRVYTFALLLITKDKPYMKVDEVISSNNNLRFITLNVEDMTNITLIGVGGSGFATNIPDAMPDGLTADFKMKNDMNREFDLEPHFSFIFTKGIGYNNLFGHKIEEESNIEQSIYYDMITEETNNTYPSFYTPFLYDNSEGNSLKPGIKVILANSNGKALKVANGEIEELFFTDDAFQYGSYYIWNKTNYNYSFDNYFLFSSYILEYVMYASNYTGDSFNTLEYKNIPKNLVFLCKEDTENRYRKGSISDISLKDGRVFWLGTDWYKKTTTNDDNVVRIETNKSVTEYHNYTNIQERYFYKIHTSFKFTEGRWNTIKQPPLIKTLKWEEMEQRGISNNTIVKGRHRNYKIIGKNYTTDVNLDNEKEESGLASLIDWSKPAQSLVNLGKWLLNKFIDTMKSIPEHLYRLKNSLMAFITSLPEKIWNGLKTVGKWISRVVLDFLAPVLEVLGDLWELGGLYLEVLSYVLSFIAFFIGMAVVVKVISYTELNKLLGIGGR